MVTKKNLRNWPSTYQPPKVYNIDTAYQQALGITYCTTGVGAEGTGACAVGEIAVGKQSCYNGITARPKTSGRACTLGHKPGEGT
jgi:hypothetical protein